VPLDEFVDLQTDLAAVAGSALGISAFLAGCFMLQESFHFLAVLARALEVVAPCRVGQQFQMELDASLPRFTLLLIKLDRRSTGSHRVWAEQVVGVQEAAVSLVAFLAKFHVGARVARVLVSRENLL
jgi:hypothetical protein